jgi:hypothetical protein
MELLFIAAIPLLILTFIGRHLSPKVYNVVRLLCLPFLIIAGIYAFILSLALFGGIILMGLIVFLVSRWNRSKRTPAYRERIIIDVEKD